MLHFVNFTLGAFHEMQVKLGQDRLVLLLLLSATKLIIQSIILLA